jgi:hypothetical protein
MGNPRIDTSFYLVTVSILYSNLKIHALQGKNKVLCNQETQKKSPLQMGRGQGEGSFEHGRGFVSLKEAIRRTVSGDERFEHPLD